MAIGDSYPTHANTALFRRGLWREPAKTRQNVAGDVDRLEEDMKSKEIQEMILKNHELARELGLKGTPAFAIGDTLVPGLVDLQTLKQLVAQARAKAS